MSSPHSLRLLASAETFHCGQAGEGAPVNSRIGPAAGYNCSMQYDLTADGRRFLVISSSEGATTETLISVVVNWRSKTISGE